MSSGDYFLISEDTTTTPAARKRNIYEAPSTPSIDCYSTTDEVETSNHHPQIHDKELPLPPKTHLRGWRFSMACGLACTTLAFLCNTIVMIWSSRQSRSSSGNFLLFSGDCNTTKAVDTWTHLVINILSTLILGASNFALQVLVAPTRENIDDAHAVRKTIEIAVPSISNWSFMTLKRRILFSTLIITSLPLHLVYNSVIFSTNSATVYQVTAVSSDFLQHNATASPWNDAVVQNATAYTILGALTNYIENVTITKAAVSQLWQDANNGSFTTVDPEHCYAILSNVYKSTYSNIILFTDYSSPNHSLLGGYELNHAGGDNIYLDSHYYYCNMASCPLRDEWTIPLDDGPPWSARVTHCSMQQVSQSCTAELIPKLLAVVIICNLLKGMALMYLLFSNIGTEPLLTLGDAIASFLDVSDRYTDRQGGLAASDTRRKLVSNIPKASALDENTNGWRQSHRRYFSSAPLFRWTFMLQLFLNFCMLGAGLILFSNNTIDDPTELTTDPTPGLPTFSQQWQAGFGALFSNFFYEPNVSNDPTNVLIANTMIANTPQLFLSIMYLTYNGLFTYMSVSAEWAGYIKKEKRGLRVTNPVGQQRGTYWLSLPFKISIPLLVMSGTLHWLLSQSIYIVRLDYFMADGTKSDDTINGVGWSPLMLIVFIATAVILLLASLAFSLQKFPPGIPIVSGNSWAISAGCHAIKPGESLQKLRYGVIKDIGDDKYLVGFSSGDVRPLVLGEYYR